MNEKVRYTAPDALPDALMALGRSTRITKGSFTISLPSTLEDMEWNHMDQLHRPYIHSTYEAAARLARGKDFALSVTRFGRWPLFLTVSDVRVKPGLYYQVMTIGGLIYLHNVIRMQEEAGIVTLTIDWLIASHFLLKPLHSMLSSKLYRLNTRLQEEDATIRTQRHALRQGGYSFRSSPADYLTSNLLTNNTLYPALAANAHIPLAQLAHSNKTFDAGGVEFIARREGDEILVWPRVCPHEGADLVRATPADNCRLTCSWHGLKFAPARLSSAQPKASLYGFDFQLEEERLVICSA